MHEYHKEKEITGKVSNIKLLRKIFHYAKPYSFLLILAIFFLVIITGTEVIRPYLIKIAIDENITGYTEPRIVFSLEDAPKKGVLYNGKVYIKEKEIKGDYSGKEKFQLLKKDSGYYLVTGVINPNKEFKVIREKGSIFIEQNNKLYPAELLTKKEWQHFRKNDIDNILKLGAIYLVVITGGLVLNYGQSFILQYAGQRIIYDLRQDVFSHLESLSIKFFDKNPVGRLVTRVTNDTAAINELFTEVFASMFKDIFLLVGIIVVMFKMNWKLALLSMISIPLILLATHTYKFFAQNAFRKARVKLAALNTTLQENISGMRLVQIFNQQPFKFKEFDKVNKENLDAELKALYAEALFRPSMDVIYSLILALLIWYGGNNVLSGSLQFGVLYAFINYTEKFFRPINDMTQKFTLMQSALVASERIFMLLDEKQDVLDKKEPVRIEKIKGEIEFKNVWFSYTDEEWVLKDINFKIEPGEKVAFVGATGSGKTTIINLLMRLYDIQKGTITIDGINIKDIKQSDLRKRIAIVMQDVFLFSGSILSNVTLDSPEISEKAAKEAIKYVGADKFIEKLPGKYNYQVRERGATLSAGERQLLSFARALAFDPDILILDEATANIDTETEILIQDALYRITKGRTCLMIAHRLSTIQNADKIIVLHKGQIKEIGNHQELLKNRGIYYKLYKLQSLEKGEKYYEQ